MNKTEAITITYSRGLGKNGRLYAYVCPAGDCLNRSRRVAGKNWKELEEAIQECKKKHFTPLNYYRIDRCVIGSNSKDGALREYWRVCEHSKCYIHYEAELITR